MKMMGMKSFAFPDEVLQPCCTKSLFDFMKEHPEFSERPIGDVGLEILLNNIANAYKQMFNKYIGSSPEFAEKNLSEICGDTSAPILVSCTTASFSACVGETKIPQEKEAFINWFESTVLKAFSESKGGICLTIELWSKEGVSRLVPILNGCRYHLDENNRIVKEEDIFSGVIEQEVSSPLLPLAGLTIHYKINVDKELIA